MSDKFFDIIKIILEKFLLAIVLAFTTFYVNTNVQDYQKDKEIRAEYNKRKAVVALEVAEHASEMIGIDYAIKSLLIDSINNSPKCGTQANEIFWFHINKILNSYLKIDLKNSNKILELSFKADLYLDVDTANTYSTFMETMVDNNQSVSLSDFSNFFTNSENINNCDEINKFLEDLTSSKLTDKAKPIYSELIKKLGKNIPDINKNGIYFSH